MSNHFFGPKRLTVESVIAPIANIVEDLRRLAAQEMEDVESKAVKVKTLEAEITASCAEADRAILLATRYEKLVT